MNSSWQQPKMGEKKISWPMKSISHVIWNHCIDWLLMVTPCSTTHLARLALWTQTTDSELETSRSVACRPSSSWQLRRANSWSSTSIGHPEITLSETPGSSARSRSSRTNHPSIPHRWGLFISLSPDSTVKCCNLAFYRLKRVKSAVTVSE